MKFALLVPFCIAIQHPIVENERSPCPAMNTLANEGYIPSSGKSIDLQVLKSSLTTVYGFSPSLAGTLINNLGDLLNSDGTLDLASLRKHNAIEHDVSLVHDDTGLGPNWIINQTLLNQLVQGKTELTVKDVGQFLKQRKIDCKKYDKEFSFTLKQEFAGLVEASTLFTVFGDDKKVNASDVFEFLGNERLPKGYIPRKDNLISIVESTRVALSIKWYT
ncbi:hypothetical protein HK103_001574 [Boothiomyces macroporosus]|uniref:Heme haloperoxidase family profile domain-containing protein n=1 Tax=Boothiomyces macroporosus TaxID=261099 RepID=A0AAD5UA90_9FUNG|nr:hypothetical protein HK103_001574 [Boothiomyces macroporosus]